MKLVKELFLQVYIWNKTDFWILNVMCVLSGLIVYLYDLHPLFVLLLTLVLLVKAFTFLRQASIMPGASDNHQFSWKYMQSLPLNKKELMAFFLVTSLFAYFPLWLFFTSFQPTLLDLFEIKLEGFITLIKLHLFIFVTVLIINPISLRNLIQLPRLQFSRKNEKELMYQGVKKLLFIVCGLVYLVCGAFFLDYEFDINVLAFFAKGFEWIADFLGNNPLRKFGLDGYLVFILFEMVAFVYLLKRAIKVWQNESMSYVKMDWNKKRDVPRVLACLVLLVLPFQFNFIVSKKYYRNDILLKSVFLGKLDNSIKLVNAGADINQKSKEGATVLMAAAENGDLYQFQAYEKRGASREGTLKLGKNYEKDVFELAVENRNFGIAEYLLHTGYVPKKDALLSVAQYCNTKLNDLLVEKGAEIKAVTKKGSSALHIAVKNKCFGSIVSLVEMGADLELKNQDGKRPYDYLNHKNDDLTYYLNKKIRTPAGKKI